MQRPQNTFSTDGRIGKLKHICVAYLWVQDETRSQMLRVHRVRSEENVADLRFSGASVQQTGCSGRQQVTMSRRQPAEICSDRSCRIRSRSRHREIARMPKKTLRYIISVSTHRPHRLRKVRTGRIFEFFRGTVITFGTERHCGTEPTTNLYRA